MENKSIVSIKRCAEYNTDAVYLAVKDSLKPLGGIENYIKHGDKVLIKPNLLSEANPDKHVTTHPTVVEAVVKLVQEAGALPIIGDSPGMASFIKAARAAGIEDVAKRTNAKLADFKKSVTVEGKDKIFKNLEIAEEVINCDKIINLPKLKTHVQMTMTLGIKNMFGCIIGKRKSQWHLMAGKDRNYFATMIVELFESVKPTLTIMDGITAMHKDGPQNGEPYPMGLIYASNDTVALDSAVTHQVGLSFDKTPILAVAIKKGLGESNLEKIHFPLIHPNDVLKKDFVAPVLIDLEIGPKFLRPYLRKRLVPKPITEHSICTLCNKCIEVCPPKVIDTINKKIIINYDGCIHCFCCVEICPEGAMTMHRSYLSRLLSKM